MQSEPRGDQLTTPTIFNDWIDLSEDDTRNLLFALIGLDFGQEPEKRIPEIKESRRVFANYIADKVSMEKTDTALDLGSGCGFGTYWFAQRAKRVHACDISQAFLRFAARECRTLQNVNFHLIQPRKLDCIADSSIDVICSMSVFIHFNLYDIYWYFKEFARIVKPGGRIWIDVANSKSLDLHAPNQNGGYFLNHAQNYLENPSHISGLMQWNSLSAVIKIAKTFGFVNKRLYQRRSTAIHKIIGLLRLYDAQGNARLTCARRGWVGLGIVAGIALPVYRGNIQK